MPRPVSRPGADGTKRARPDSSPPERLRKPKPALRRDAASLGGTPLSRQRPRSSIGLPSADVLTPGARGHHAELHATFDAGDHSTLALVKAKNKEIRRLTAEVQTLKAAKAQAIKERDHRIFLLDAANKALQNKVRSMQYAKEQLAAQVSSNEKQRVTLQNLFAEAQAQNTRQDPSRPSRPTSALGGGDQKPFAIRGDESKADRKRGEQEGEEDEDEEDEEEPFWKVLLEKLRACQHLKKGHTAEGPSARERGGGGGVEAEDGGPMQLIVTRLLEDRMTPDEFEKAIFLTLSNKHRRPLLQALAEEIMCTSKVMKLMSVMLDLPGDVMDLNTLTKCLLDRAIQMTGAQGGRILLKKQDAFILSAEMSVDASEGGRIDINGSLPYKGICKKVFEEGVTLMHDHVGSLAGIYSQKVDSIGSV